MFDWMTSEAVGSADGSALVTALAEARRVEAVAAGARFMAIAELLVRNEAAGDEEAALDGWANTTCEVGAALGITARRASSLVHTARALRNRLPRIGALLRAGTICERVATVMCWRTMLLSPEAAAAVDTDLAEAVADCARRLGDIGRLPDTGLEMLVDTAVCAHDPDARYRVHRSARGRTFEVGKADDELGVATVWGALLASDKPLVERTIDRVVAGVCKEDPRGAGELRSDAAALLLTMGGDRLACRCNRPECPQNDGSGVADRSRAGKVIVHVLADQAAVDAAVAEVASAPSIGRPWLESQDHTVVVHVPQDSWEHRYSPAEMAARLAAAAVHDPDEGPDEDPVELRAPADPGLDAALAELLAAETPAPRACTRAHGLRPPKPPPTPTSPAAGRGVAVMVGGPVVPIPLLAELIRTGATLKALAPPGAEPEPHYRPSARLALWDQARDLLCRFPGCSKPADRCDIDHVTPYPHGPTHPGNNGCDCRTHHLAKTFTGWRCVQAADGTLTWTSPNGARYATVPLGGLLFPQWDIVTPLPAAAADAQASKTAEGQRGLAMPKRCRTRAQDQAARIAAERAANHIENSAYDAEMEAAFAAAQDEPDEDDEPPPF